MTTTLSASAAALLSLLAAASLWLPTLAALSSALAYAVPTHTLALTIPVRPARA